MKFNFYKLSLSACAGTCCLLFNSLSAQTVADFDGVEIPEGFESLGSSMTAGSESVPFDFISGNVSLTGIKEFWGGVSAFDCSNSTDNTTFDYTNDRSAITGEGADGSSNYVIAFLNSDWPDNPTSTFPIGLSLTGDAVNSHVLSVDVTNSTYAYLWIMENLSSITYFKLTVQGYNDGEATGTPVEYFLAQISETDTVVVNTWETIDLTQLGAVDSITFKLDSDNDWSPFYFALDNIVTFDNNCTADYNHAEIAEVESNSVDIAHNFIYSNAVLQIEYAVDESSTIEPSGSTSTILAVENVTVEGLSSETSYYYHYRTKCINEGWSDWDTLHFTTKSTHVKNHDISNETKVYPNPSNDRLYVDGIQGALQYRIFSVTGQLIYSGTFSDYINIEKLQAGNYILNIFDTNNVIIGIKKFTKID